MKNRFKAFYCFCSNIWTHLVHFNFGFRDKHAYILTVETGKLPEQDDFHPSYVRVQLFGRSAETMAGDHNFQRSQPVELVRLLEAAP